MGISHVPGCAHYLLILSLISTEQALAPFSRLPPSSQLQTAVRFPLSFLFPRLNQPRIPYFPLYALAPALAIIGTLCWTCPGPSAQLSCPPILCSPSIRSAGKGRSLTAAGTGHKLIAPPSLRVSKMPLVHTWPLTVPFLYYVAWAFASTGCLQRPCLSFLMRDTACLFPPLLLKCPHEIYDRDSEETHLITFTSLNKRQLTSENHKSPWQFDVVVTRYLVQV